MSDKITKSSFGEAKTAFIFYFTIKKIKQPLYKLNKAMAQSEKTSDKIDKI